MKNQYLLRTSVILLICLFFIPIINGQIRMPRIFSDGMVLQQQTNAKIWGKATPGKTVSVTTGWDNKKYSTMVAADSLWSVDVATPEASKTSYRVIISTGKDDISINNVLIGEVWLCSGQSNMDMRMNGNQGQPIEGGMEDIVASRNDNIRTFIVSRASVLTPQFDCAGEWMSASPQTTGRFSAVGYYFARIINQVMDIPVALVHSAWGGSSIEAWIPEEGYTDFPDKEIPRTEEEKKPVHTVPTVLYNGMIQPIAGFAMRGALWYQGETNIWHYNEYASLFKTMHSQWEEKWGIGRFPLYFCQLAPYRYKDPDDAIGGYMREVQHNITKNQENTAIAVLMDAGEEYCIHPAKKRVAGERLAYIALAKDYGYHTIKWQPAEPESFEFKGNEVIVKFTDPGVGPINMELDCFQVAGADRVFYPATGKVEQGILKVNSRKVPEPVAVRYAFTNFPKSTLLIGGNGLPISSFRSDDWEYEK